MTEVENNVLPPGWELKYDRRTGKHYYLNYLTKMTSWEDPRGRSKPQQIQGTPQHYPVDFVAQQSGHGSPYHVYPSPSPMPLQHAFQHSSYPPSNLHSSFSPKALPKQITELGGRSYGSPLSGGSPVLGRGINLTPKGSPQPGRISYLSGKLQDTSLTMTNDVDVSVAKISSMFPTVSETHIKILLKKYYNREAVVISALQVEKHPISTPGPFSTPPAGISRLQAAAAGVYAGIHMARGTSPTPPYGSSPRASPPLRPQSGASGASTHSTPIPHSSPKMKLRYLKSLFPKAEETLILDLLAGEENNVQKTSEKLIGMGYVKKDNTQSKAKEASQKEIDQSKAEPPAPIPPRLKTTQEKQELKLNLQKKYSSIPERVVSIALESVGWSEERAEQILSAVLQEDVINKKPKEVEAPRRKELDPLTHTEIIETIANEKEKSHQSPYLSKTRGPNSKYVKGAQDNLLLVDYITWNGANPELKSAVKVTAVGPAQKNRDITSLSRGPKKDLCKGPSALPKGSIYQHINSSNFSQMKVGGE